MVVSYLFIPGNSLKMLQKGLESQSDAVIIDLEDAVLPVDKYTARQLVVEVLKSGLANGKPKVYVRINSFQTKWCIEDLQAITSIPVITGIMLPKSEDQESITVVSEFLAEGQELIPLIETAKGVYYFKDIVTASSKIKKVAFGSVDYALDLGVEWTEKGEERRYAMGALPVASRALGLDPPIDAVFPIIQSNEAFLRDANIGKEVGFYGKLIIHPKHIELVKQVYKPSQEQIIWSKQVIKLYEGNTHQGAIQLDGKLIDLPLYLLAKRIVGSNGVLST
jgi:citrate lyase subunit beta/citryl-CoA lyase